MVVEQSTIMNNVLTKLGLTPNEAKVYVGYLSMPNKSAAFISKTLKMDKSSTYKAVESLLSKSLLLRESWDKGFTYKAANPKVLKEMLEQQEIELSNKKELLSHFISSIKEKTDKRSTIVTVEKGMKSIIKRMNESLKCKERLIRECFRHHEFSNNPEYIKYITEEYAPKRVKKGIYLREFQAKIDRNITIEKFGKLITKPKQHLKEQRLMPKNFSDRNSFRIWDDTTIIISYDIKNDFVILTIKDKYIAGLLKDLYDYIWDNSKPVVYSK